MKQAYALKTTGGDITAVHLLPIDPAVNATVSPDAVVADVKGKRVLLHIHGGLVSENVAKASAHRLSRTDDGKGVSYDPEDADVQLYLIWRADITTTLKNLLDDSVFGKVVDAIEKWFGERDTAHGARDGVKGGEGIDDATLERYYQTELKKTVAPALMKKNDLVSVPRRHSEEESKKRGFFGVSLAKIAVQATRNIFARGDTNPKGYRLGAMVREEVMNASGLGLIGQQIWGQMKATAVQHATGGFQTFLQQVYEACLDLTLVGHSTGANIITALLPTLKAPAPNPEKLKVVFLAPAVTIKEFKDKKDAFRTHLHRPLRIYTMDPGVEMDDTIKWQNVVLYPGSLLQLVNFVFEDPRPGEVLGMAHYTQEQTFDGLVKIITDHECTSHGGFDDARDVLQKALKPLKEE